MAGQFMTLEEAAQALGVSPDDLVELRSQGKIRGFRDGASWKFKPEDVERYKQEQAEAAGASDSGPLPFDDLEPLSEAPEAGAAGDAEDQERTIAMGAASQQEPPESAAVSDVALVAGGDSDLKLVSEGGTGSDVTGGTGSGGSDVLGPPGGSDVLSGSDVELKSPSGGGTGDLELGSSGLELGDEDLELGEEDDLVLGGSGVGSDVTLDTADSGLDVARPSDSGINLAAPSDSGLSLEEEPAELAASSGSLEGVEQVEPATEQAAEAPAADDQFLLAPSEELGGEEESESGSQEIALEETEMFEEAPSEEGPALLVEETAAPEAAPAEALAAPALAAAPAELPEAPYTVWNVVSLALVVLLLGLAGVLMTDVVRNMWSWNEPTGAASGLMDAIVAALGLGG